MINFNIQIQIKKYKLHINGKNLKIQTKKKNIFKLNIFKKNKNIIYTKNLNYLTKKNMLIIIFNKFNNNFINIIKTKKLNIFNLKGIINLNKYILYKKN